MREMKLILFVILVSMLDVSILLSYLVGLISMLFLLIQLHGPEKAVRPPDQKHLYLRRPKLYNLLTGLGLTQLQMETCLK